MKFTETNFISFWLIQVIQINMKKSAYVHFSLSALLVFSMLAPTAVLALGDGKKYFKEGMKAEIAEQWDKAAEEFALAVVEDPRNPE